MEYEWDSAKNEANILAGRSDFAVIEGFEWETAVVIPIHRSGEMRWAAHSVWWATACTTLYSRSVGTGRASSAYDRRVEGTSSRYVRNRT